MAAIGTDTGGSIRVPAALCGLAGFRASIGLTPALGLWEGAAHLAPSFDTLGWLYRDLRDGPLLGEALFGLEPASRAETQVRIGTVPEAFLYDCEFGVREGLASWLDLMRQHGAEIVFFDADFWQEAQEIFAPIQAHEAASIHLPATGGDFSPFEPSIAEKLAWGASLSPQEVLGWRVRHDRFRARMDELLRVHDYLALPCAPMTRLPLGGDFRTARPTILRYTVPMSLAGMPVVTLPSPNGAGVQLVAPRGADARVLAYSACLGRDRARNFVSEAWKG